MEATMKLALNRLTNLLKTCKSFDEFKMKAIQESSWYLAPYCLTGHNVNNPWIESFWKTNKGGK